MKRVPTLLGFYASCAFAAMVACAVALVTCATAAAAAAQGNKPNFIFILVDDLGWTDLGCYGSRFYETPNIDRLASQGMRFTQAYSACTVCSPTRASVLTGQYPARLHITDWIPGHARPKAKLKAPDWNMHLSLETMNLAKAFKSSGYVSASIGKWHLGNAEFFPEKQGFDLNVGGNHRGQPPSYFSPYKIETLSNGPEGEFLTDRESIEAQRFIEANRDRPFFLYLAHYAVHQPIQAKAEVIEKYRRKRDPNSLHNNAVYAGLIESVDQSVGHLLRKLDELKIAGRTIIVFTSDNGGLIGTTSNAPLRVGKGSAYEGGVRVPLIVRWPGATQPGSTCEAPVMSIDFYPTLLDIAGVKVGSGHIVDGESLTPLLKQAGSLKRDMIFWHYPHYHPGGATPYGAVRASDFKLIEFFEDDHLELYDLKNDPVERVNLANQRPAKVQELRQKLTNWRQSVSAQMPSANPNYDPKLDKLPPHVVQAAADRSILLHARDVEIHGSGVRYEPQPNKNTIGYWTNRDDWVSWEFRVAQAGPYRVEILQGCGPGNGGSEIELTVSAQRITTRVVETKGFQDFLSRDLGTFRFEQPGRYTLSVKPLTKAAAAVMDLRQVTLRPVAE